MHAEGSKEAQHVGSTAAAAVDGMQHSTAQAYNYSDPQESRGVQSHVKQITGQHRNRDVRREQCETEESAQRVRGVSVVKRVDAGSHVEAYMAFGAGLDGMWGAHVAELW